MTIPQFIFTNISKYPTAAALIKQHHDKVETITYQELRKMSFQFAGWLVRSGIKHGDKIGLFSENRPEWVIADLGIQIAGAVTVPIHSVFQPRYIHHVLQDSGARLLVLSDSHLFEKLGETHEDLTMENIIYFARNKIFGIDNKKFLYFHDLLKNSETKKILEPSSIESPQNAAATIIYTSGTTGMPKGVPLTHSNIVSNVEAINRAIPVFQNDRFLSILPLSHIFERTAGCYTPLARGAAIFFGEDVKSIPMDLLFAKPTILLGVPRIFEKAYNEIQSKPSFHRAKKIPGGKFLIARAIKKRFGGAIRFCISGGAPLHPSLGIFFNTYGLRILEGYGLTETSPVVSCNRFERYKFGSCGLLLDNVSVQIAPDGELLVKGPSIMNGYHNALENDHPFTNDGYFKTGDIARIDENGFLFITGRKKNIIILSTGKNVQPEEIETALDASPLIAQVCVVGDGRKMATALIVPEKGIIEEEGMVNKSRLYEKITAEINRCLKHFPEHEQVKNFTLLNSPFLIERDELTPTLKIKRAVIEEHYRNEIDKMYQ